MKFCKGCCILKPLSEYNCSKAAKDGRQSKCKDCQRAASLKHYHSNKDYYKEAQRKRGSTPEGRANRLWHGAKERSERHNLEFSLNVEWIVAKIEAGKCEVTGLPFELNPEFAETWRPWSPSLDRIDRSKGYTEENTQVVCWLYNQAKGVFDHGHVITLAEALIGR